MPRMKRNRPTATPAAVVVVPNPVPTSPDHAAPFPAHMPMGQFLFEYLHRRGVRHCFGVPGDYGSEWKRGNAAHRCGRGNCYRNCHVGSGGVLSGEVGQRNAQRDAIVL